MMEFYREHIVKNPRKQHYCFLCGEPIVGEHVYMSCKNYDFWTGRAHIACNEAAKKMCNACDDSHDCTTDLAECYRETQREQEKEKVAP